MKHSWTVFATTLSLCCSSLAAHAAAPSAAAPRDLCEQIYQQAVRVCPLVEPSVCELLLPAAPLVTASSLRNAQAKGDLAWLVQRDVAAQVASDQALYDDYNWYAQNADSNADYEVGYGDGNASETDSSADGQNAQLDSHDYLIDDSIADARYEMCYGYDSQGRPIEGWRHGGMVEESIAADGETVGQGYSEYDDPFADDYLTKYHELLHGKQVAELLHAPQARLASRLSGAIEAATYSWSAQVAELAEQLSQSAPAEVALAQFAAVRDHISEAAFAASELQDDPYRFDDDGDGAYGYGGYGYYGDCGYGDCGGYGYGADGFAGWDSDDQGGLDDDCFDCAAAPCETTPNVAADWQVIRQLAHSLDRAGSTLQQWSRSLGALASRGEQAETLQTRKPAAGQSR